MAALELSHRQTTAQAEERGAALALLPVAATIGFYALPDRLQARSLVQFTPQIIAYLAFALWAARNDTIPARLGLEKEKFGRGVKIGLATGIVLGCLNTFVVLHGFPSLGYDIAFLKQTPHAQLPATLMLPWVICGIALFVEVNFRGFLLGRLAALESAFWTSGFTRRFPPLSLLTGAFVFSFDPFMLTTFQHLHWIAVWDGLVWGTIWVYTRNLHATIVAHAIEVVVMYSAVRAALTS